MLTNTTHSPYAKVSPLPWDAVRWSHGFWADAFTNNCSHTVPQLQHMFEATDISHVVENFRICANRSDGSFDGTVFGDGDFYKWLESAIYSAAKTDNRELLDQIEEYITLIGEAQQPDGYLSTKQIIGERSGSGVSRHGDINDFEVYNFGHLFTAACLHKQITGKNTFFQIAERVADYLYHMYQENIQNDTVQTAVCPSHYMGLVEMYRISQNEKYLELACLAISLRDSVKNGMDDNQDRIPLKEHTKILGHAVRANYLYAGLADLCLEQKDPDYTKVLENVWNSLVRQKLYLTGGCGALYNGASPYGNFFVDQKVHQAYGYEYQLPNITAYNETCASVGSVMWAYRMFQLEPKAEYFDLIERTMLNVNLASISLDGKRFFYENMLRRTKELPYELIWPLTRSEYILSYCCPPNIARAIAQSSEYAYMVSENTLWLGMYGASEAQITLPDQTSFKVIQETSYPYDGAITLHFEELGENEVQVQIRIPQWAEKGTITIGDRVCELTETLSGTYYPVTVSAHTPVIQVQFHMDARYTVGHSMIEETCNQAAVERGPLVYCIESADADVDSLDDLLLDPDAVFQPESLTIEGRPMTALKSTAFCLNRTEKERNALYHTLTHTHLSRTNIRMIPYFAWDNRGFGEMRIWLPMTYHV